MVNLESENDLDLLAVEFDEGVLFQRGDDVGQMGLKQRFEIACANVARANEQQFPRLSLQQMRMIKIQIFGDDHTLFPERKLVEDFVGCPVLSRQAASMNRVVPRRLQQGAQAGRQVRVHHEFHASATGWPVSADS